MNTPEQTPNKPLIHRFGDADLAPPTEAVIGHLGQGKSKGVFPPDNDPAPQPTEHLHE